MIYQLEFWVVIFAISGILACFLVLFLDNENRKNLFITSLVFLIFMGSASVIWSKSVKVYKVKEFEEVFCAKQKNNT